MTQPGEFVSPEPLLRPRSIALIGASERVPWPVVLWNNLRHHHFAGQVFPVNPTRDEFLGARCWRSVAAIGEPVDLAIVIVRRDLVQGVVEECAGMGVKAALVISSGFAEEGSPEGLSFQRRLGELARERGITLAGPNCLGYLNLCDGVPALAAGLRDRLIVGPIGLVMQSGALATVVLNQALRRAIGFSFLISSGNEAHLEAADYLKFLVEDERTRVVTALIESFKDPAKFLAVADLALERGKPIVLIKTGSSEKGRRAAVAHTGALTGSDEVQSAVFAERGVIRVGTFEELIEVAGLIGYHGLPKGRRVGMITFSGGFCGIASDLSERIGVELAEFSERTRSRLRGILPPFATAQNPLDLTGGVIANLPAFRDCCEIVSTSGDIDILVFVGAIPFDESRTSQFFWAQAESFKEECAKAGVMGVLLNSVDEGPNEHGRSRLSEQGWLYMKGTEHVLRAIRSATWYAEFMKSRRAARAERNERAGRPVVARIEEIVPDIGEGGGILAECESKALLARYGVPSARHRLVSTPAEAARAAAEIGFPVVLKIESRAIPHKTDAGVVALGVRDAAEAERRAGEILDRARSLDREPAILGISVHEELDTREGVELLAGAARDAQFGPYLLLGTGGVFAEVLRDTVIGLVPLSRAGAIVMIERMRGSRLLAGYRGRPPMDTEAVATVLLSLSRLMEDHGDRISEIDVNPLFARPAPRGALALDALVVLSGSESSA